MAAAEALDFAAAEVEPQSVRFGLWSTRAFNSETLLQDIDGDGHGDGYQDLVLRFKTEETGIACGDSAVTPW